MATVERVFTPVERVITLVKLERTDKLHHAIDVAIMCHKLSAADLRKVCSNLSLDVTKKQDTDLLYALATHVCSFDTSLFVQFVRVMNATPPDAAHRRSSTHEQRTTLVSYRGNFKSSRKSMSV